MNFLLWCALALHIFSMTIWIGGLLFSGGVMTPILTSERKHLHPLAIAFFHRFSGFTWMSVGVMLVTGIALMLFHPHFIWFDFSTEWSQILLMKQIIFFLMVGIAWLTSKSVAEAMSLSEASSNEPSIEESVSRGELIFFRLRILQRLNIILGIGALLLAAALASA